MISDEKMSHVVHLIFDGLKKSKWVEFADEAAALREAKKVCTLYLGQLTAAAEVARARIASQKNPPPEYSAQWNNLFQKYLEEETRKRGG